MTADSRGFTLLDALVSLIIAAMGIVAISHLIHGATRAESTAQAMEKAAMLADHAVDCAVLQGNLFAEAEAGPLAQAAGWSMTISRQPSFQAGFEEIRVVVAGEPLQQPVEVRRLVSVGAGRAEQEP